MPFLDPLCLQSASHCPAHHLGGAATGSRHEQPLAHHSQVRRDPRKPQRREGLSVGELEAAQTTVLEPVIPAQGRKQATLCAGVDTVPGASATGDSSPKRLRALMPREPHKELPTPGGPAAVSPVLPRILAQWSHLQRDRDARVGLPCV